MERFNRTLRGYDPEEVNVFLDKVIGKVETMALIIIYDCIRPEAKETLLMKIKI